MKMKFNFNFGADVISPGVGVSSENEIQFQLRRDPRRADVGAVASPPWSPESAGSRTPRGGASPSPPAPPASLSAPRPWALRFSFSLPLALWNPPVSLPVTD